MFGKTESITLMWPDIRSITVYVRTIKSITTVGGRMGYNSNLSIPHHCHHDGLHMCLDHMLLKIILNALNDVMANDIF